MNVLKKLRFLFAMLTAKTAKAVLKLFGRNATYMPGKIAIKLCPDFLGYIKQPETLIAVTGTNGKTTVSNMLTTVLTDNGYKVTNNSYGSNVQSGIAAALLADCTITGKSKNKIAVLEVDERSSLLVYPYIKPDILICNNIMRDSLKRNAHTDFITYILNSALPKTTHLVLNADDLICATLGPENKNKTYFGVEAQRPPKADEQFIKDMVYCPNCSQKLEADYVRYNHIGRFHCPACGLTSPERDYCVTSTDSKNGCFTVEHKGEKHDYKLINDNIINIYNFCGVIAVLSEFGIPAEKIAASFEKAKIVKSRFDTAKAGKLNITMMLAKGQNPIACTRAYSYVAGSEAKDKAVIVLVDDKGDNTNNSESTCWLYDSDYSFFANDSIKEIIFGGKRCRDHLLRAQLSGVDASKIKLTDNISDTVKLLDTEHYNNIYVLYDPYLIEEAQQVKNTLIRKGEKQK